MSAMENYAAWVMGEVPRLKYYDSYISPECPLILHGTIRDYHRAILRLFGVSDSHIVNVPAETDVSIEDLIFASPTYRRHIPSPGGVAFLKQSSNSFSLNHQWKGSKIYLTRDGQKMRRMLNEQQIHGALEKEGYQIIRPESVSVLDQISMFSLAKTIVTPFGATLANMAFCNQRPHVCVIRTKFTNEFARLSVMAGARLSVFDQVLRFKAPLFSKDRELHQTFRVDPELLLAFLKRFEEKSD